MAKLSVALVAYAKLLPHSAQPDKVNEMFTCQTEHPFLYIKDDEASFNDYLALQVKQEDYDPSKCHFSEFINAQLVNKYQKLYAVNGFDIDPNSLFLGVIGGNNEEPDSKSE